MQKEMAVAEHEVRAHEDRLLEHMERSRNVRRGAEGGGSGAQGRAGRGRARAEGARGRAQRRSSRSSARLTAARSERGRAAARARRWRSSSASRTAARASRVAEARDGLCTRLPRPAAAAGVQRGAAQRQPSSSATAARASSTSCPPRPRRRRGPALLTRSMIVAYIDGGARGNPGPAGYGVRIEVGRRQPSSTNCTARSASRPTTSPNTTACSRRCSGRSITASARPHPRRLGAARQADARRIQGQESRAAAALRPRAPARRAARRRHVRARAARAEQGSRPAVEPRDGRSEKQLAMPENAVEPRDRSRCSTRIDAADAAAPNDSHHPARRFAPAPIRVEARPGASSCTDRRRGCARRWHACAARADRGWRATDRGRAGRLAPVENQRASDPIVVTRRRGTPRRPPARPRRSTGPGTDRSRRRDRVGPDPNSRLQRLDRRDRGALHRAAPARVDGRDDAGRVDRRAGPARSRPPAPRSRSTDRR